jgi:hypothetical protein
MLDTVLVSLAVMAGVAAIPGVPLRSWQFVTGRYRSRVPPHALARVTFNLFAALFLIPSSFAWAYALYVAYVDFTCAGTCAQVGVSTAIAFGMLGCAYALLEGFLLTARRGAGRQDDQSS